VKIGVVFPQTEIGADPGAVRAYAERVAELGYTHVLAYDHVLGADPAVHQGWDGPYDVRTTFHEPLVLFGYLAALTPLELVPGILILPQRQTALVAKQAAEVDLLTSGRFRLGVGLGWNAVEYEALGKDFTDRGRRMTEQISLLRRLWTDLGRGPVPPGLRPGRPARRRLVPPGAAGAAAGRSPGAGRAGRRRGGPRPVRARHGGAGQLARRRAGHADRARAPVARGRGDPCVGQHDGRGTGVGRRSPGRAVRRRRGARRRRRLNRRRPGPSLGAASAPGLSVRPDPR